MRTWYLPALVFSLALSVSVCPLFGDDTLKEKSSTEDEFFGSQSVEAEKGQAESENLQDQLDKEMVRLSGNLEADGSYNMTREFAKGLTDSKDNQLGQTFSGDFLVDIRMKKGFKAFLDISLGYLTNGAPLTHTYTVLGTNPLGAVPANTVLLVSENTTTLINIKEAFFDFNIANAVFFRLGKQVLQWGPGNLWNPTDLINIERRDFFNPDALRQGAYGLRSDVVFAREFHLFTFLDFNELTDISNIAAAARAEILLGTVELGLSGWVKRDKIPVFGLDVSFSPFWEVNFYADAALSWGFIANKLDTNGVPYSISTDQVVPRISAGISKSFTAFDVDNRIIASAEFYYNAAGYDDNMFEVLSPTAANGLPLFVGGGYYSSGDYGKLYGALFVTINELIITELALSLSGIGNISDSSYIALAELVWTPVDNFSLSMGPAFFLGPDKREYTVSYNPVTHKLGNNLFSMRFSAKVAF